MHAGVLETVVHVATLVSITVPFAVAYLIYRDIYGILNKLWEPFRVIMIGIAPLYALQVAYILQDSLDLITLPSWFPEYVDHAVLSFSFLCIGYAFLEMRNILNNYGALVKEMRKLK